MVCVVRGMQVLREFSAGVVRCVRELCKRVK